MFLDEQICFTKVRDLGHILLKTLFPATHVIGELLILYRCSYAKLHSDKGFENLYGFCRRCLETNCI